MTDNTERDALTREMADDIHRAIPLFRGMGLDRLHTEREDNCWVVAEALVESGYEKRESVGCSNPKCPLRRAHDGPCAPEGWREQVVVDDSAQVVDELLIEIDDLADSIDDHVTTGDIHDALTMLAIRIRNGWFPDAAFTPDGQETGE